MTGGKLRPAGWFATIHGYWTTGSKKKGSPTFPIPGYNVQVLDKEGEKCKKSETGNIVIHLTLPPSWLPTLWNDDERFKNSYLSQYPGYYFSGDEGIKDEDG